MVTLDNKIINVGNFKGDLQAGRRDYERAKQGSELIHTEKLALEEALGEYTEFDDSNLPEEPAETTITIDNIKFIIKSETHTKRPSYKTAVEGMENYIRGVAFLVYQGHKISWIFKEGRHIFSPVSSLVHEFNIIVGGIFNAGVEHTIRYEVAGKLSDEKPLEELVLLKGRAPRALNKENFLQYVRMDKIEPIILGYIQKYEKELFKGQRKGGVTQPITTRSAYITTKSKAEGPDWAYVVKTLITVPTEPEKIGELNVLDDQKLSKAENERMFPYYKLMYKPSDDDKVLYVSLQSVSKRIQTLKEGPIIEAKRLKIAPVEIV